MIVVGPSSAVVVPPTLTLGASTNYNQNSAVLNATVTATGNRAITSVEFQWSNSPTFTAGAGITISDWTAAATNTVINQGTTGTARTLNATGLSNGTAYYVRFRATNSSGFVTTSSIGGGFTTYSLRTETFTGSRTWTNPRTSSGTSGLAITSIQDLVVVGSGGGNCNNGGGGGGAYVTSSSISVGSSVVVAVGAGGSAPFGDGNASSIAGSTTVTANGAVRQNANSEDGGTSGNGNPGGIGSGSTGGGGGGAGGAGGNWGENGGNGGAGISGYGTGGGGVGGDFGNEKNGSPTGNGPANTGQGGGATRNIIGFLDHATGGSGYAQFKYWGP